MYMSSCSRLCCGLTTQKPRPGLWTQHQASMQPARDFPGPEQAEEAKCLLRCPGHQRGVLRVTGLLGLVSFPAVCIPEATLHGTKVATCSKLLKKGGYYFIIVSLMISPESYQKHCQVITEGFLK